MGAQSIPPKSARTSSVSSTRAEWISGLQDCVRLASVKLWVFYSRFYSVHTVTVSFVSLSSKASVSRYKPCFKETGGKTHRSKGKLWVHCDLPGDWYGVIWLSMWIAQRNWNYFNFILNCFIAFSGTCWSKPSLPFGKNWNLETLPGESSVLWITEWNRLVVLWRTGHCIHLNKISWTCLAGPGVGYSLLHKVYLVYLRIIAFKRM